MITSKQICTCSSGCCTLSAISLLLSVALLRTFVKTIQLAIPEKKKYWRSRVAGKGLFMDLTTARDGRNEAGGR